MAILDWLPTPADVGAHIRARTKDTVGRELGTFTADTRPTDEQVVELIDSAVARIERKVGTVPEDLQPSARRISALATACLVELSYFPEQINTGRSPYPQLKALLDEDLKQFVTEANDINTGGELGGADVSAFPVFGFPDETGMVGLCTEW